MTFIHRLSGFEELWWAIRSEGGLWSHSCVQKGKGKRGCGRGVLFHVVDCTSTKAEHVQGHVPKHHNSKLEKHLWRLQSWVKALHCHNFIGLTLWHVNKTSFVVPCLRRCVVCPRSSKQDHVEGVEQEFGVHGGGQGWKWKWQWQN